MAKPGRPGAAKGKKGPTKGTGGKNKRSLEGRGPTPKAEDRAWHPAGKRKAAAERYTAAGGKGKPGGSGQNRAPRGKKDDDTETVTGRNSVLEALRAKIPATAMYIAQRVEMDDRVKEMLSIATNRGIPVLEVTRPELDRMAGFDGVHQGVALKVPPYSYAHPQDLLEQIIDRGEVPLLVALDGVTDPRNLGAIIRSTGAFGGQGLIIPQRRSASVNSAAWKTSAGAAARIPVALAANLTATLKEYLLNVQRDQHAKLRRMARRLSAHTNLDKYALPDPPRWRTHGGDYLFAGPYNDALIFGDAGGAAYVELTHRLLSAAQGLSRLPADARRSLLAQLATIELTDAAAIAAADDVRVALLEPGADPALDDAPDDGGA